jgi:hypothetical protein
MGSLSVRKEFEGVQSIRDRGQYMVEAYTTTTTTTTIIIIIIFWIILCTSIILVYFIIISLSPYSGTDTRIS